MKAWVLDAINDFHLKEINKPQPGKGEVLVAVKAAGICGSDIPRIYKTGTYHYPLIPGHEFSGQVVELGEGVDTAWLNKRVGVFPLIPCGKCGPCQQGMYELCRQYSYIGSRQAGAFAEYVAVPAKNLIELPESVSYKAAAMLEPLSVAVHAVRRSGVLNSDKKNSNIAVCGLGTIGMLISMVLLKQGYKNIFLIGNKDFQKEKAVLLGLKEHCFCDVRHADVKNWLASKTENGVDVFFECVGKSETIDWAIDNAAPGGHIVMIGNPASDVTLERNLYWKILRNQLVATGSWNSSFTGEKDDDWHYAVSLLSDKSFLIDKLITHKYSLDDLENGMMIMRDKSQEYIKIMAIWE